MSTNEIKTVQTRRQAERALLGAVLAKPALLDAPEVTRLQADDFGAHGYREIWRAIQALCAGDRAITAADVQAEMEGAGATDLAALGGIATAPDLRSALAELAKEGRPERAINDASALHTMGANLDLAERLVELADQAKTWPPRARDFFCESLDALAELFCAPLAGAH